MAHRFTTTDALVLRSWDTDMWAQMQEGDVLTNLTGTYSEDNEKVPDGIVMRVNLEPGRLDRTIGLIKDLTGTGVQGAGAVVKANCESFVTRKYTVYANDVRHGVESEVYGFYAHLNEPYGLLEKVNPALEKWNKAKHGMHKRQAILELCSDNLEQTGTSLTSGWNKNWLIKNVTHAAQPSYDSTLATFTGNIITAMATCGYSTDAQADMNFFTDLIYYITNKWKLAPLDDGSYVVLIPSRQAMYLKRLYSTGESFGDTFRQVNSEKYIAAAFGQYLMKIGPLHLIVDDRAPIVNYTPASGAITAYYRGVGETDDRASYTASATNRVFDIGMVLGKGALTETWIRKPHFEQELDDHGRLKEISINQTYGYQCTEFDADTATDSTKINQSSAIIAFYAGSATA